MMNFLSMWRIPSLYLISVARFTACWDNADEKTKGARPRAQSFTRFCFGGNNNTKLSRSLRHSRCFECLRTLPRTVMYAAGSIWDGVVGERDGFRKRGLCQATCADGKMAEDS